MCSQVFIIKNNTVMTTLVQNALCPCLLILLGRTLEVILLDLRMLALCGLLQIPKSSAQAGVHCGFASVKKSNRNFPDGSVLQNPPRNERTWVQSLTRELRTTCHRASKPAYTAVKDPSCYNRDPAQPNKYFLIF